EGDGQRQEEGVEEGPPEVEAGEELRVVLQGRMRGEKVYRQGQRLAGGHQRRREHPQERHGRERRSEQQRAVDGDLRQQPAAHALFLPRNRACKPVAAMIIANSTKAIAAAAPRFHQRNPCWYISRVMEVVAYSGPPRVIT